MSYLVFHENETACEKCDLINSIPTLYEGERFRCARCRHVLVSIPHQGLEGILSLGFSALLMLFLSISFPFLGFSASGISHHISLLDTIQVLLAHEFSLYAIVLFLFLMVLPVVYLFVLLFLVWSLKRGRRFPLQHHLIRWIIVLQPWLMVDVFLVGVFVALVKIHSLANISLGMSFWAFCGFVIAFVKVSSLVDHRWLWNLVAGPAPKHALEEKAAVTQNVVGCHFCGAVLTNPHAHCERCGHRVYQRRPESLMSTLAFLLAACAMYIPANLYPMMETTFLGKTQPSTILSGVFLLWDMGSYPVAIIILIASVFIPIAKILAMGWLCWQSCFPTDHATSQKYALHRISEFVGRWSMVDIFVVAILSGLVQMGNVMNVLPGPAAMSFACVVIFTMLAAMTFDPRLLWDSDQKNTDFNKRRMD